MSHKNLFYILCDDLDFSENLENFMETKHKNMYTSTSQQRSKRLALEITTLSTALPLSYSSSVYLRCDTDRMDLMKVISILIVYIFIQLNFRH